MTLPIAVLISGTGSNLRAILEAIEAGRCRASVRLVVSDRARAPGLAHATSRGIPTAVIETKQFADRAAWDRALAETVAGAEPKAVVLAGFMKIVGPAMLARFPHRMLNVHPALLPAFPGADGPRDALAAGVRISGCTVHIVDAGVDTGPIVAQAAVPVLPDDDRDRLHKRIQAAEHLLLPAVLDAIARGSITLGNPPSFARYATDAGEPRLCSPAFDRDP